MVVNQKKDHPTTLLVRCAQRKSMHSDGSLLIQAKTITQMVPRNSLLRPGSCSNCKKLIQRLSARTKWLIILLESNVQMMTQKMKTMTKMRRETAKEKEPMVKLVDDVLIIELGKLKVRPWLRRKAMKRKRRQITTRNRLSPLHFWRRRRRF